MCKLSITPVHAAKVDWKYLGMRSSIDYFAVGKYELTEA
jgi:hypothetical protein